MNVIALKIKKLRSNSGMTQEQMAERVHLSLKAWQKIENGITKLDLDRLNQVAEILETSLVDLINTDGGVYVHQEIEKNNVGYTHEVTVNEGFSDVERDLFNRIIADKDKEIEFLREILQNKK